MSHKIWASLDDYLPPAAGPDRVGRNMANYYFFKALMRYGSFDEYHFFLSNSAHRRLFNANHGHFLESISASHKVKLFDRADLPSMMKNADYEVFHQSDHINLFNALCRTRNSLNVPIPVTAFIHSISYQEHMSKYLEMLMGGVTSSDAVICSSNCGKTVIDNCFEKLATGLNLKPTALWREIIPLGIDESDETVSKADARRALKLDENETIALCFGRFSDFDKMDLFPLLQAFRRAYKVGKPWRLILAGALHSDNYLKMVQLWAKAQGLADRVTFFADLPEVAKKNLYRACDFFVSPSDNPQETFGLTLLEAIHAGLPLIVSDFNGYREIGQGDVAIRVPTSWSKFNELGAMQPIMDERTFHLQVSQAINVDVKALAEAMKTLFEDENRRKAMGLAARDRFEQEYRHQRTIERLEGLWRQLKSGFKSSETSVDPLSMDMFETFSHYVTSEIPDDTKIVISDFGRQLQKSKTSYPLLANMADMIDHDEVFELMNRACDPLEISKLTSNKDWRCRYLVMWMLKHELLEVFYR